MSTEQFPAPPAADESIPLTAHAALFFLTADPETEEVYLKKKVVTEELAVITGRVVKAKWDARSKATQLEIHDGTSSLAFSCKGIQFDNLPHTGDFARFYFEIAFMEGKKKKAAKADYLFYTCEVLPDTKLEANTPEYIAFVEKQIAAAQAYYEKECKPEGEPAQESPYFILPTTVSDWGHALEYDAKKKAVVMHKKINATNRLIKKTSFVANTAKCKKHKPACQFVQLAQSEEKGCATCDNHFDKAVNDAFVVGKDVVKADATLTTLQLLSIEDDDYCAELVALGVESESKDMEKIEAAIAKSEALKAELEKDTEYTLASQIALSKAAFEVARAAAKELAKEDEDEDAEEEEEEKEKEAEKKKKETKKPAAATKGKKGAKKAVESESEQEAEEEQEEEEKAQDDKKAEDAAVKEEDKMTDDVAEEKKTEEKKDATVKEEDKMTDAAEEVKEEDATAAASAEAPAVQEEEVKKEEAKKEEEATEEQDKKRARPVVEGEDAADDVEKDNVKVARTEEPVAEDAQ